MSRRELGTFLRQNVLSPLDLRTAHPVHLEGRQQHPAVRAEQVGCAGTQGPVEIWQFFPAKSFFKGNIIQVL